MKRSTVFLLATYSAVFLHASFREKLNPQSHKEAVNDRISKADHRIYGIEYQLGKWSAIYTFARWEANRAARSLLPFKTKEVIESLS